MIVLSFVRTKHTDSSSLLTVLATSDDVLIVIVKPHVDGSEH
jgi:hypothetical protein